MDVAVRCRTTRRAAEELAYTERRVEEVPARATRLARVHLIAQDDVALELACLVEQMRAQAVVQ